MVCCLVDRYIKRVVGVREGLRESFPDLPAFCDIVTQLGSQETFISLHVIVCLSMIREHRGILYGEAYQYV